MILANKSKLFDLIFSLYNRNLIKRRFEGIYVCGLESLLSQVGAPFLVYANHSSWWDGLIAYEISRLTSLDWYVMMEEKQLKKYFFFRWLGAFSIVRNDPKHSIESINYAATLLNSKNDVALLIFPQGKIEPNDLRPIKFESGIARIVLKLKKVALVPMACRYEFLGAFKPEIFVKLGSVKVVDGQSEKRPQLLKQMQHDLTTILDELKSDICHSRVDSYRKIL